MTILREGPRKTEQERPPVTSKPAKDEILTGIESLAHNGSNVYPGCRNLAKPGPFFIGIILSFEKGLKHE